MPSHPYFAVQLFISSCRKFALRFKVSQAIVTFSKTCSTDQKKILNNFLVRAIREAKERRKSIIRSPKSRQGK